MAIDHDIHSARDIRGRSGPLENAAAGREDLDRGTRYAGALLGVALLLFCAYMLLVGPTQ